MEYGKSISVNKSAVFNELANNTVREKLAEVIFIIVNRLKIDKKNVKNFNSFLTYYNFAKK